MAKILTEQLGALNDLLCNREKQVMQAIAHLSVKEVKAEKKFTETLHRLKAHFLLNPVNIEEPTVGSHSTIVRKKKGEVYQRLINLITVHFPFSGNKELFNYRIDGDAHEESPIYTPELGNMITIKVELDRLDRARAVSQAEGELETTKKLIAQNNLQVEMWTKKVEAAIDHLVDQKRKELVDFYC